MTAFIKHSFTCGALLFGVNIFFLMVNEPGGLLVFAHILPGFIYAGVLAGISRASVLNCLVFTCLSGILFIGAAFFATASAWAEDSFLYSFPPASVGGAVLFYCLYFWFIDSTASLGRGVMYSFVAGLISAIPAIISILFDPSHPLESTLYFVVLFMIFPLWQTLFGWMLSCLSRQPGPEG